MRKFGRLLVLATALAASTATLSAQTIQADAIYEDGKIVTLDGKSTVVEALAIKDGHFLATGSSVDMKAYAGPGTEMVDLDGRTVVPGLMDTHAHFIGAGEAKDVVNLKPAKSVAEALQLIKAWADKTPPGKWIQCGGWHPPSQLKEKRYLTRQEIDSVAPNNPVYLRTVGHYAMANTKALEMAGIDKSTPNPEGGIIERDQATGEATGILVETAIPLVESIVPEWTFEERVGQVEAAMKVLNSYGLTSVIDGGIPSRDVRVLREVERRNEQTLRVGIMYRPLGVNEDLAKWKEVLDGNGAGSGFGDEWLKFAAIGELGIDGGMTLRTAYTRGAYPDDKDYHGLTTMEPKRVDEIATLANQYGWRVGYHCVGDAACDLALDAFEAADKEKSIRDRRFILIHASLLRPDQMERAKKLGVRADIQNVFMWDKAATVARFLGKDTADRAVPARSMIDIMGIDNVAAGTDYPVNTINPFINMYIMVTRKDPNGVVYGANEAISREEALRLYTISAAHYNFEEDVKGMIEPGKLADFVVLSDDVLSVDAEKIKDITAEKTVVGGKVVYKK